MYNRQMFTKAITDYDLALKINPNYAVAYNNRGLAKAGINKPDEAIKDYDKAIEINPNQGLFYFNRAISKNKKMELKESGCNDLKIAIKLGYEEANRELMISCK